MNVFQALGYFASEAIGNLVRGWRISALAVATTALSLFIGGVLLLAGNNMARAIESWRSDAQIVVYLDNDLTGEEIATLTEELLEFPGVDQVGSRISERFCWSSSARRFRSRSRSRRMATAVSSTSGLWASAAGPECRRWITMPSGWRV